jgi:drug/metabolite transporter (DMT)-like permease
MPMPATEAVSYPPWITPGVRYMVGSAFFFSAMSLGVKLVGQRIPSQEVVLVRGVLNAAFTYAMLRRARVRPWGNQPSVLILRGLFGFLALSCVYYALVHLPLADATVLQYTNPIWTALLAAWLLGERMRKWEVVLVLASLLGVLLIARPAYLFGGAAARLDLLAVAAALVGSMFSAGAYVTVRQLARTEDPLVIVFYFTLVTVAGSLPGTMIAPVWPEPREWGILLLVALTAQAGQVMLTRGLQLEPAGRATAIGYLQIVFAAVWGAVVFAEYPDGWVIAGAGVILGSTLVLVRLHSRAASIAPSVTPVSRESG